MINLLRERRSIRKFEPKRVEKEKTDLLKKAALLAPSSRSLYPLEFIFIENKELIEKLSQSKSHGSSFLKGAPLAVVVIGDETKSDVWIEDGSIATIITQLQAEDLGLKSCWIQIRLRQKDESISSEDYIKELLEIPKSFKVLSIIAIGYPDETKTAYKEEDLNFNAVRTIE